MSVYVLGVSMAQLGADLGSLLGGNYVNFFNIQGRSYKVVPQVDRVFRLNPDQLGNYYISTGKGRLVPLSTLASVRYQAQPQALNRFQQLNAATITCVPMTGEKFLRGLMTPIDPKHIFFMLQSGYPADFLLGLTVESLNGVRNRSTAAGAGREADPEFIRALELMREVQAAGAVGMRVEEDKAKGSTAVLFFRRDDLPAAIVEQSAEIRRLLKLSPDAQKFVLAYSPVRGAEGELAVNSRSMLQIMAAFASYLDVPEAHLKDHSAVSSLENAALGSHQDCVRIHSGKEKPANAFAAVQYRQHWFWIDDGDWKTKRALTAGMFFFTLAETGDPGKLPLITIPAQ